MFLFSNFNDMLQTSSRRQHPALFFARLLLDAPLIQNKLAFDRSKHFVSLRLIASKCGLKQNIPLDKKNHVVDFRNN